MLARKRDKDSVDTGRNTNNASFGDLECLNQDKGMQVQELAKKYLEVRKAL
jgi:hypothetical protein